MVPVKLFLFSLIAIWTVSLQVEATPARKPDPEYIPTPNREYPCGHLGKDRSKVPANQPHFHEYPDRDVLGHFKIRQEKYRMHKDETKRKEACCAAKKAISGAWNSDPDIFKCLWDLWKNKYCYKSGYKRICKN